MIIESEIQARDGKTIVYYDDEFNFCGHFLLLNSCEIWDLMIFENFRRLGHCQKMLQEFIETFDGNSIILWVEDTNIHARKAYENIGFCYTENVNKISGLPDLLQMKYQKEKCNEHK